MDLDWIAAILGDANADTERSFEAFRTIIRAIYRDDITRQDRGRREQRGTKGIDPVKALFSARSALYERYALDDIQTALWRSFPFRVYRLN